MWLLNGWRVLTKGRWAFMDNIAWEQGACLFTKHETCKSLLSSNVDLGASTKDGGV